MKKNILVIVVIAILMVASAVYIALNKKGGAPVPANLMAEQPPLEVPAIVIKSASAMIYEELPGRTTAYKSAEIRPQVSGIVTERLFEEGSAVQEGQQLYQINPDLYKATLDSALADLGKAQANVKSVFTKNERYKDLVKINAISKQEYDDTQANLAQAQAEVAIAEASVASAKINLNYTKVYAPISGRIGKSSVTKGALVTASQTQALATITQLDPMYVDMTQSSADLMRLRHKMEGGENIPVKLILDGESEYKYEGKLQFHEVTVDQTTGSVQLRALFPNPDGLLLPGLFVRARLQMEYPDAILIPQKASVRNPDGTLAVWVADKENVINPRVVEVEKSILDGQWVVKSGLNSGDIVITGAIISLKPGMKVSPKIESENIPVAPEAAPNADGK